MNKRPNKLDAHAADLRIWLAKPEDGGENLTLDAAAARLRERGVKGTPASLRVAISKWWTAQRLEAGRQSILHRIASGRKVSEDITKQFSENPPPELENILALLRVVIMQQAVEGKPDDELVKLATLALKPILENEKQKISRASLELEREKFERLVCEKVLDVATRSLADEIAGRTCSNAEKIAAMRQVLFKDLESAKPSAPTVEAQR